MKRNLIIIITILLASEMITGQERQIESIEKSIPIVITFGNNAHSMPFYKPFRSDMFYPSVSIGREFDFKKGKAGELFFTLNLAWSYHKHSIREYDINATLGYRTPTLYGAYLSINMGAGLLHGFHPKAVYKSIDGEYKQIRDWGKVKPFGIYNIDLGYDFSKKTNLPACVFIRYKQMIYKYSEAFPMLNSQTQIGTKIFINK